MAKTKLTVNILSIRSLEQLKDSLESYVDSLDDRAMAFVKDLTDCGITVARTLTEDASHQMGRYIVFEQKFETIKDGAKGILIAKGETLVSQWFRTGNNGKPQEVTGSINALLATEFGTAAYALPPYQGTNSKYGHGNKTEWYFAREEKDGKLINWQHATAIQPTRPLHNAFITMEQEIENAARRNF